MKGEKDGDKEGRGGRKRLSGLRYATHLNKDINTLLSGKGIMQNVVKKYTGNISCSFLLVHKT